MCGACAPQCTRNCLIPRCCGLGAHRPSRTRRPVHDSDESFSNLLILRKCWPETVEVGSGASACTMDRPRAGTAPGRCLRRTVVVPPCFEGWFSCTVALRRLVRSVPRAPCALAPAPVSASPGPPAILSPQCGAACAASTIDRSESRGMRGTSASALGGLGATSSAQLRAHRPHRWRSAE